MKLYLYRTRTRRLTTDGVLRTASGQRICDTAEYTPARLPKGTYEVIFKRHPKYKRRTPYIIISANVSSSPRGGWVGVGNGVYSKDFGSNIIVGEHLVPGVVIRSYPYFKRIVKGMEKSLRRHRNVELIIV